RPRGCCWATHTSNGGLSPYARVCAAERNRALYSRSVAWWRRPFGDALGLRRDWLFLVILTVAVVIRIMAMAAFRPGLELYGDSYDYVSNAFHLRQGEFHPIGYAVFLRLLSPMRFTVAV